MEKVFITKCNDYENSKNALLSILSNFECLNKINSKSKVLIKANLVSALPPEKGATTNYLLLSFLVEYLKNKGYDEEYCNICLLHSYLNNDVTCTAGGGPKPEDNPFLTDFIKNHEYTIEEKIINLCDLMCPHGYNVFTIDKRLIDLIIRKGAYANTQYHVIETYKLKKYFDDLLGYNLYDLFPEIKDNL